MERAVAHRAGQLAVLAAMAMACGAGAQQPAVEPPRAEPPRAAEPARLAARGLLIAIAAAGPRLVAVGDRGIIVLSDDRGVSWTQAAYVPTQALLTGVCFLDERRGVAVGHDEVILTTEDAGRNWKLTHYAPQAQRPLLDVWCGGDGRLIAVGAYSAYFTSDDHGTSWRELKFAPAAAAAHGPAPAERATDHDEQPDGGAGGYHLNRIVGGAGQRLYIAAEAGHLYGSEDGGGSWRSLVSPYGGSFFGVLPLGDRVLLAFGLRGHLYRSADGGASWQPVDTATVAMLTGAVAVDARRVAIVGLAGVVLVSGDGGRSFSLAQQADRSGLSAVLSVGDGRLAVVGETGARVIPLEGSATP